MYRQVYFSLLKLFLFLCFCFQYNAYTQQHYWPDGPARARIVFIKEIDNPEAVKKRGAFFLKIKRFFSSSPQHTFIQPAGLDVDNGILVVADPGAGGVHLINQNKSSYAFLAPKSDLNKNTPIDVAIGDKKIYISYTESKVIEVFSIRGKFLKNLSPKFSVGRFTGIFYHHPNILIVDTPNHTVSVMNQDGVLINTIGKRGNTAGCFNFPSFITISENGYIYISDTMNFRVQVFTCKGEWLNTVSEQGVMSGQLNRPKGIATDDKNNLYVIDASFDNVQIFSDKGQYLLHFGSSGHEPGQFAMPTDIAIDGDRIYVSDTMNHRIQIFKVIYE